MKSYKELCPNQGCISIWFYKSVVSIKHRFWPFCPLNVSQIWPLLFIIIVAILMKNNITSHLNKWPPICSYHIKNWVFPGHSPRLFQKPHNPCISGLSQSPLFPLRLHLHLPLPLLLLLLLVLLLLFSSCLNFLIGFPFLLDKDHQD